MVETVNPKCFREDWITVAILWEESFPIERGVITCNREGDDKNFLRFMLEYDAHLLLRGR
ncbi:hypothetical protein D3C84_1187820 [compost metagenome]